MRKALIFLVAFRVCLVLILKNTNAGHIKLTNVRCTSHNETWIQINVCRLKAISRNKTILNLNLTLLHPANNIVTYIQLLSKANGYKPWLYNTSVDWCRFIKKPYNPIAIAIIRKLQGFTNFNHSCPYVGDQIVDGVYGQYGQLGIPYPTGDYQIKIGVHFNQKKQLTTEIYFSANEEQ